MLLSEIRTKVRELIDDAALPYLWSDERINEAINNAQNEACRRSRLLVDSRTKGICTYQIKATNNIYSPWIYLDPRVLFVRRAKLDSNDIPLVKKSSRILDEKMPGWEIYAGCPYYYITEDTGALRLVPIPDSDDTLRLTIVRLPINILEDDEDEPEINQRFHYSLVHWVLYELYMSVDAEKRDDKKIVEQLTLFEKEFGQKSTAIDEEWIRTKHGFDGEEGLF